MLEESVVISTIFCFVERTLDRSARMCPKEVSIRLVRCFLMRVEVSPGQVAKKPASIAAIHVSGTGFHMEAERNSAMSFFLVNSYAELA